jgi:cell wall-associated NlpC family hydrolase
MGRKSQDGDSYQMGAAGPNTWDCSSFTQAAYRQIGITIPRTASANAAGSPPETARAFSPAKRKQEA